MQEKLLLDRVIDGGWLVFFFFFERCTLSGRLNVTGIEAQYQSVQSGGIYIPSPIKFIILEALRYWTYMHAGASRISPAQLNRPSIKVGIDLHVLVGVLVLKGS